MNLKEQIQWCKTQIKSEYEVIAMRSILTRLQSLEKIPTQPHPYHNKAIAAYKEFLKSNGLPEMVDSRQGAALKELLPMLQPLTTTKSDEGAYKALLFILSNWNRLNTYHQSKKTLIHIKNNLVEILDQIRNGKNKQQNNLNEAQRFHNELTKQ